MKIIKNIFLAIICSVCIFLIFIITMDNNNFSIMQIKSVDPSIITRGENYNVFNGKNTMSVYGIGFKEGDSIYINKQKQETTFASEEWLTCFVEDSLVEGTKKLLIEVIREDISGQVLNKTNKYIVKIIVPN